MSERLGIGPADVAGLPREALPALLAELAAVQAAVAARLAAAAESVAPISVAVDGAGRDLTEAEAAMQLRKSIRWVRDNWRRKGIPGVKRGRVTVFPEAGLEQWRRRH